MASSVRGLVRVNSGLKDSVRVRIRVRFSLEYSQASRCASVTAARSACLCSVHGRNSSSSDKAKAPPTPHGEQAVQPPCAATARQRVNRPIVLTGCDRTIAFSKAARVMMSRGLMSRLISSSSALLRALVHQLPLPGCDSYKSKSGCNSYSVYTGYAVKAWAWN